MKTSVKSLLYIVGVVVIFLCGWLLYRYVYNENVAVLEGVVECRITEDFGEQERWESFVKQINE